MAYITGKDLEKMQKKGGFTNTEMAKVAGVKTRKTFEYWKAGKGEPNLTQFFRMGIACRINMPVLTEMIIKRATLVDDLDLDEASRKED